MNDSESLCVHRAIKFTHRRTYFNLWRIDKRIMVGGMAEGVFAMDSRLRGNDIFVPRKLKCALRPGKCNYSKTA